jgi:transcriptional regulator with XRE-family HTH domain
VFEMSRAEDERRPPSVFPGFDGLAAGPEELIDRLVDLRRRRGLSQTAVAARMGTSQSALARLESGQADVRLSTLMRYASALDAQLGFDLQLHDEEDER